MQSKLPAIALALSFLAALAATMAIITAATTSAEPFLAGGGKVTEYSQGEYSRVDVHRFDNGIVCYTASAIRKVPGGFIQHDGGVGLQCFSEMH